MFLRILGTKRMILQVFLHIPGTHGIISTWFLRILGPSEIIRSCGAALRDSYAVAGLGFEVAGLDSAIYWCLKKEGTKIATALTAF